MKASLVDGKVVLEMSLREAAVASGFYGKLNPYIKEVVHNRCMDEFDLNPSLEEVKNVTFGVYCAVSDVVEEFIAEGGEIDARL